MIRFHQHDRIKAGKNTSRYWMKVCSTKQFKTFTFLKGEVVCVARPPNILEGETETIYEHIISGNCIKYAWMVWWVNRDQI